MTSVAEQHLTAELRDGAALLEREIGYDPTSFMGMVGESGSAEVCRRLIRSSEPSEGFTILLDAGRLDMTVEALSLLPWYSELFDPQDAVLARQRLEQYRFDVDAFIRRQTGSPPGWFTQENGEA